MRDFAYIALTVVFFALMIAYVRACERLGKRQDSEKRSS